jgi:molecular chaperone IbpA
MRTTIDLSPFRRTAVGFDRLFDLLESGTSLLGDNYPPFDLEQIGDDHYRITLALAGFKPEDIDVTAQQDLLIVSGRKPEQHGHDFVHRGIANRPFERRFVLGDYVKVESADMTNGLLSIELVREIPEEMKPRRIELGGASQARLSNQPAEGAANQNQHEPMAA